MAFACSQYRSTGTRKLCAHTCRTQSINLTRSASHALSATVSRPKLHGPHTLSQPASPAAVIICACGRHSPHHNPTPCSAAVAPFVVRVAVRSLVARRSALSTLARSRVATTKHSPSSSSVRTRARARCREHTFSAPSSAAVQPDADPHHVRALTPSQPHNTADPPNETTHSHAIDPQTQKQTKKQTHTVSIRSRSPARRLSPFVFSPDVCRVSVCACV